MSNSQSMCHQWSYSRDMVNVMGTLPEMVTLGCLPQVLPKWTVPAHGWQSWSQGWWWEIHLVEARGFYLLSLGCCHWRKGRDGEKRETDREREEKSEPGLGEVVLTSTDHWPPLPLCFTVQTCDEDMWSLYKLSEKHPRWVTSSPTQWSRITGQQVPNKFLLHEYILGGGRGGRSGTNQNKKTRRHP